MGRTNRSRKRKAQMDRIKKERNSKKELLRLKKTLGLLDGDGNDLIKKVEEIVEYKTPEELKKVKMKKVLRNERIISETTKCISLQEKEQKEEKEILDEIKEEADPGENVEVVNENTKKVHVYNTKTMRDQYGTLPPWMKTKNTARKIRRKEHAMKKQFNQAWVNKFVPI